MLLIILYLFLVLIWQKMCYWISTVFQIQNPIYPLTDKKLRLCIVLTITLLLNSWDHVNNVNNCNCNSFNKITRSCLNYNNNCNIQTAWGKWFILTHSHSRVLLEIPSATFILLKIIWEWSQISQNIWRRFVVCLLINICHSNVL